MALALLEASLLLPGGGLFIVLSFAFLSGASAKAGDWILFALCAAALSGLLWISAGMKRRILAGEQGSLEWGLACCLANIGPNIGLPILGWHLLK